MKFELLDEKDGLSSHYINSLAIDSFGYLWLATLDGLNRYDGQKFKVFRNDPKDTNSLKHNFGQRLFADKFGQLWVSIDGDGFGRFDAGCQCFQHFKSNGNPNLKLLDGYSFVIYVDDKKRIWFSGPGKGLCIFDEEKQNIEHYPLSDIDDIYSDKRNYNVTRYIYPDKDEKYWLTSFNGLYRFDDKSNVLIHKPYYKKVIKDMRRLDGFLTIHATDENGFWISSWGGGIHYFDKRTEKYQTFFCSVSKPDNYNNIINGMIPKSKNEFWVSTNENGFGIFNTDTRKYNFLKEVDPVLGKKFGSCTQIINDKNGMLYFVAENELVTYNPSSSLFKFSYLPIANSQNSQFFDIVKILEDRENNALYFGTYLGNGFNSYDISTKKLTGFPIDVNPLKHNKEMVVSDILKDNYGKVWVLTRDYIYRFLTKENKLKKLSIFPSGSDAMDDNFRYFSKSVRGNFFIITQKSNVYKFNSQSNKVEHNINLGHNNQRIVESLKRVKCDGYGNVWALGIDKFGYFKYPDYKFITIENKIVSENISALQDFDFDLNGNIWMNVTENGVIKLSIKNNNIVDEKQFNKGTGFPTSQILNMETDSIGNVWMVTIKNVLCMDVQKYTYRTFDKSHGMAPQTLSMRLINNGADEFYITYPGHFTKVDIKRLQVYIPKPSVYIDNIEIENKKHDLGYNHSSIIKLKTNQNFFTIEYGLIDIARSNSFNLYHKLEGYDEQWIPANNERKANYVKLAGGTYQFMVKAVSIDGVYIDTNSIQIFLATPYYKTSWFLLLLALSCSTLIYLLYKYRINEIGKMEGLKTEFNKQLTETRMEALRAQMNPHFIFNCLNSINSYIALNDADTSSRYLTKFAKLIRLILDNSKSKIIPLSSELEALKLYIDLEFFRFGKKFKYEFNVKEDVVLDDIMVPPLIIQPYVENSIWHGLLHKEDEGILTINVRQNEEILFIEIIDNGIGRTRAQKYKNENTITRKSHGLRLTEDRLQNMDINSSNNMKPEIIDLYDDNGNPVGTKVIIKIYINEIN